MEVMKIWFPYIIYIYVNRNLENLNDFHENLERSKRLLINVNI